MALLSRCGGTLYPGAGAVPPAPGVFLIEDFGLIEVRSRMDAIGQPEGSGSQMAPKKNQIPVKDHRD